MSDDLRSAEFFINDALQNLGALMPGGAGTPAGQIDRNLWNTCMCLTRAVEILVRRVKELEDKHA